MNSIQTGGGTITLNNYFDKNLSGGTNWEKISTYTNSNFNQLNSTKLLFKNRIYRIGGHSQIVNTIELSNQYLVDNVSFFDISTKTMTLVGFGLGTTYQNSHGQSVTIKNSDGSYSNVAYYLTVLYNAKFVKYDSNTNTATELALPASGGFIRQAPIFNREDSTGNSYIYALHSSLYQFMLSSVAWSTMVNMDYQNGFAAKTNDNLYCLSSGTILKKVVLSNPLVASNISITIGLEMPLNGGGSGSTNAMISGTISKINNFSDADNGYCFKKSPDKNTNSYTQIEYQNISTVTSDLYGISCVELDTTLNAKSIPIPYFYSSSVAGIAYGYVDIYMAINIDGYIYIFAVSTISDTNVIGLTRDIFRTRIPMMKLPIPKGCKFTCGSKIFTESGNIIEAYTETIAIENYYSFRLEPVNITIKND